jgi:uncharacterized iron-regulated membrane protein
MFQFLGELFLILLMLVSGWFGYFKPERLVGYDGSPNELRKRARGMKRCGAVLLVCGSLLLIFLLLSLFIKF